MHAHEGELDLATFNHYWTQESQKMFGKSITLSKDYDLWWSYIPHFIHSPFYCYAYSYGQLLVLALMGFIKKVIKQLLCKTTPVSSVRVVVKALKS